MNAELVEIAENGWGLMPRFAGVVRREVTPEAILVDQPGMPTFRFAIRVRFSEEDCDARVAGVRRWFADQGRDDFTWVLGTTATPASLVDKLLADGAVPAEEDSTMAAMVLTDEPEAARPGIDIRLSETFADALVVRDLTAEIFGVPAEDVPSDDDMRQIWEVSRTNELMTYIAFVDGTPVGRASCCPTERGPVELLNGCVLPEYRGRGVYRALVRARWDDAVRRGSPVLVIQAGAMSRPILERLGFRTVGSITRLVDRTDR